MPVKIVLLTTLLALALASPAIAGMADALRAADEMNIREQEAQERARVLRQQTELLRQQTEMLRRSQAMPMSNNPSSCMPHTVIMGDKIMVCTICQVGMSLTTICD
jgi:hypothetical protein